MNTLIAIFVFIFGAIIGSFLNVVILRFRSGRTLGGRSMCFSCGKTLGFAELVPIGSFLSQKGRCSGCETRISWQYPLVEALTGVLFMLLFVRLEYLLPASPLLFAILFVFYAILISILISRNIGAAVRTLIDEARKLTDAAVEKMEGSLVSRVAEFQNGR